MRLPKYISLFAVASFASMPLAVRAQDADRKVEIERIEVRGTRLLKDIGIQRTRLDTVALHDNIALSMGDVLLQNTNTFIKSYGRGTMATVSVRGTAPSHTQVTWNGLTINSPMLGTVDFSLVPSYFIDDASLYTGASAVGIASGGLGGAITLDNRPTGERGFGLRYIQGVGSFMTFDEYLRFTYGGERWSVSTRLLYSSSRNDFKYTNYAKLPELSFDDSGHIVGRKYPTDRNRNGDYGDFHLLQEAYCNSRKGDRFGATVWYMFSDRGVPKLSTDYRDDSTTRASQRESTLRAVLSWDRILRSVRLGAKAGYTYTDMLYRYLFDITGTGVEMIEGIRSQSYVHSAFGRFEAEYSLRDKLMVSANVSANQHFVSSSDESVYNNTGDEAIVGYRQARFELAAAASVRYRPVERLGLAVSARWDLYGTRSTPVVPAAFVDYLVSRRGNVVLKASVTRNYRYPTLNDLYFQPGGNPDLKPEHGFTYDGGASFDVKCAGGRLRVSGRGVGVRFIYRRLDSVASDIQGILDAAQHTPCPQLRLRGESVADSRFGRRVVDFGERTVLDDALAEPGRPRVGERPLARQATALYSGLHLVGDGSRVVAGLVARLQVAVLQRTLHRVVGRHDGNGRGRPLFHERRLFGETLRVAVGRTVGARRREQPLRRGVRDGAFAPDAGAEFRNLHRHIADFGAKSRGNRN